MSGGIDEEDVQAASLLSLQIDLDPAAVLGQLDVARNRELAARACAETVTSSAQVAKREAAEVVAETVDRHAHAAVDPHAPTVGIRRGLANSIEPYVLGVPYSLVWVVGWVLLTFVVLGLYHLIGEWEERSAGAGR